MGAGLLIAVSLAYLGVALSFAREKRYGMALAFLGYTLANFGIIWDMRR